MRLHSLFCSAAGLLLALPRPALGADPFARGIDPVAARPALGLESFLTLEGGRTPPARSWQLQLGADYVSGLMALKVGDEKAGDLVEARFDLHLLASYAVADWLELGIDLPATAWQRNGFHRLSEVSGGFDDARPRSSGLGDTRLLAKLRVLSQQAASPVTVALLAELHLPIGDHASFLGERGLQLAPRAIIERSFGEKLRVAFEGGYRYRAQPGQYLNLYVGDELTAGLGASWLLPKTIFERWAVYGELLAATPARAPLTISQADALKSPLELLLGVRADLGRHLRATLGAGTGLATRSGFGRESFRVFALLSWQRVFHDRDGDGIADEDDACPDDPEDLDGFEDSDGCPDPDNDRDGIPDEKDRCPNQPGLPEHDGCPDSDGDDIPDPDDKCPTQPGPARNGGCPEEGPAAQVEKGRLLITGAITFDSGKATIKRESFPVLDEVAALLKAHVELERIRVEGHTDNVGSAAMNLDLSQRRARSVVEYLVAKGVASGRLTSEGYGIQRPIAPNTTVIGRAMNRRVEFQVLDAESSSLESRDR